jgi:hypothetical protein
MAALTTNSQTGTIIADLERRRFFGSLEIKFEAGQIVLLRKTETIKPTDRRMTRGDNEREAPPNYNQRLER